MNISESVDRYLAKIYYAIKPFDGTPEGARLQADPDFIPTRSFFYPNPDGSSSSIPIANKVLLEDLCYWKKEVSPIPLKPKIFDKIFGFAADRIAMATGVLDQKGGIGFSLKPAT
ncbi:MAG: hypothetical protein O3B87_05915, partial [bacterium]|nr:hypothetical protein [bacterium]